MVCDPNGISPSGGNEGLMSSSACRSKRESGEQWEHVVRGAILSRAPEVGVL
jgi:hypothetical protein